MEMHLLALGIGLLAGLRALAAPAAVSWAAYLGWLDLRESWLSFLSGGIAAVLLTLLAVGELVTDQLPKTPSRKTPMQFGARILSGGLCGAAIGVGAGNWIMGMIVGAIGAVIGTLGGYEVRQRLATAFHRDRPAALVEDVVAVAGVLGVAMLLRSPAT